MTKDAAHDLAVQLNRANIIPWQRCTLVPNTEAELAEYSDHDGFPFGMGHENLKWTIALARGSGSCGLALEEGDEWGIQWCQPTAVVPGGWTPFAYADVGWMGA